VPELEWGEVLAPEDHLLFLRALFGDVAFALGRPSPFSGREHPLTAVKDGGVLRNV